MHSVLTLLFRRSGNSLDSAVFEIVLCRLFLCGKGPYLSQNHHSWPHIRLSLCVFGARTSPFSLDSGEFILSKNPLLRDPLSTVGIATETVVPGGVFFPKMSSCCRSFVVLSCMPLRSLRRAFHSQKRRSSRSISRHSRKHVLSRGSACLVRKRYSGCRLISQIVSFSGQFGHIFAKENVVPELFVRELSTRRTHFRFRHAAVVLVVAFVSASLSEMPCVTLVRAFLTLDESQS